MGTFSCFLTSILVSTVCCCTLVWPLSFLTWRIWQHCPRKVLFLEREEENGKNWCDFETAVYAAVMAENYTQLSTTENERERERKTQHLFLLLWKTALKQECLKWLNFWLYFFLPSSFFWVVESSSSSLVPGASRWKLSLHRKEKKTSQSCFHLLIFLMMMTTIMITRKRRRGRRIPDQHTAHGSFDLPRRPKCSRTYYAPHGTLLCAVQHSGTLPAQQSARDASPGVRELFWHCAECVPNKMSQHVQFYQLWVGRAWKNNCLRINRKRCGRERLRQGWGLKKIYPVLNLKKKKWKKYFFFSTHTCDDASRRQLQ